MLQRCSARAAATLLASSVLTLTGWACAEPELSLVELLETPFSSATRSALPTEQTPASVYVITRDDIRERGYESVADALRVVPGFTILDDLTFEHLGVRGVYAHQESPNETIKLMFNGQPVSFMPISANFLGTELIPLEAVERIEIVRGPGAAVYGANAFLAVVNVITADPTHITAGAPASSASVRARARAKNPTVPNGTLALFDARDLSPVSYVIAVQVDEDDASGLEVPGAADIRSDDPVGYPSPGWDALTRRRLSTLGLETREAHSTTASAFGEVRYRFDQNQTLSLSGSWQYLDRPAPFLQYSPLAHDLRYAVNASTLWLSYRAQSLPNGLSLEAHWALHHAEPASADRHIDPFVSETHAERSFESWASSMRLFARHRGTFHEFTAGLDYSADYEHLLQLDWRDDRTGTRIDRAPSREQNGQPALTQSFINLGPNVQLLVSPVDELTIVAGARLDLNNRVGCRRGAQNCVGSLGIGVDPSRGANLSSRIAAVGQIPEVGYGKLLYGSSFKPPAPNLLYSPPMSSVDLKPGDPTLSSQTADTWEMILGRKLGTNGHLELGFYHTRIEDLLVALRGRTAAETRNAQARFTGVELSYSQRWTADLRVYGGVNTILDSEIRPQRRFVEPMASWDLEPANDLFRHGRFPDLSAQLGASYLLAPHFLNFNLEAVLVGPRRASLQNNELFQGNDFNATYTLGSYALLRPYVTTHKLFLLSGPRPSEISVGASIPLGDSIEPGTGGLDIPARGTTFSVRWEQWL